MGAGRRAKGPEIVEGVSGSDVAKHRGRVVLEVIAGQKDVQTACLELGIQASRFEEIRQEAMESLVASLEPRSPGRPRSSPPVERSRVEELEEENSQLRRLLVISHTREELAVVFPHLVGKGAKEGEKKGRGRRRRA